LEDQEPLLEQTRLEHRRLDIESRIKQLESDVRNLKSNHVMLEDGDKKDAIFSEICGLDSEIFQLKAELATVNSLLSSYLTALWIWSDACLCLSAMCLLSSRFYSVLV
jgi:hypothetical protein